MDKNEIKKAIETSRIKDYKQLEEIIDSGHPLFDNKSFTYLSCAVNNQNLIRTGAQMVFDIGLYLSIKHTYTSRFLYHTHFYIILRVNFTLFNNIIHPKITQINTNTKIKTHFSKH